MDMLFLGDFEEYDGENFVSQWFYKSVTSEHFLAEVTLKIKKLDGAQNWLAHWFSKILETPA